MLFYGHYRSYDIRESDAADSIDILGMRSSMNIKGWLSFSRYLNESKVSCNTA